MTNTNTKVAAPPAPAKSSSERKSFAATFGLGNNAAAKNVKGGDIMIDVLTGVDSEYQPFIPPKDEAYVFNIDLLKTAMIAVQMNTPLLLWGVHGTGKTTLLEQFCAHTNRPAIRVQHTVSTEEAHILGQILVKNGETVFEPGPLAVAMKYGLFYIADEYDFALPNVCAVYQPVLEGKALIIKEAPKEWRVIEPHPNFRIAATGNTNGSGDETGLYQGTQIQNAANYSRFGVTAEVSYMSKKHETAVVASQARIHPRDAAKLVDFAQKVRDSFNGSEISTTISPRELINAGKLGRVMARPQELPDGTSSIMPDLRRGLQLAFVNRLNSVDRQAVDDFAQHIFG